MADSLDDFFARKDRAKKTKGKKTLPMSDDATDESAKESKRKEKEKAAAAAVAPASQPSDQNEEENEWKEVDDQKDYSGLKIQSMTIRDKEDEIRDQKLQEAVEQSESKRNDPSGPWKTSSAVTGTDAPAQVTVREEKKETETTATSGEATKGKYIPPGLRNQPPAGSANTPLVGGRLRAMRSSKAPEIENQSEFPSLGAQLPDPDVDQSLYPLSTTGKTHQSDLLLGRTISSMP